MMGDCEKKFKVQGSKFQVRNAAMHRRWQVASGAPPLYGPVRASQGKSNQIKPVALNCAWAAKRRERRKNCCGCGFYENSRLGTGIVGIKANQTKSNQPKSSRFQVQGSKLQNYGRKGLVRPVQARSNQIKPNQTISARVRKCPNIGHAAGERGRLDAARSDSVRPRQIAGSSKFKVQSSKSCLTTGEART
jgi:hypothetical protein